MKETENRSRIVLTVLEVILVILFIAIFVYILNEHAPKLIKILESGNIEEIDNYLMQYGAKGKLLLVVLQVIETFSIVLPSIPVYVCAGVLFGKLEGVLVCYIVNLILTMIIFALALRMKVFTKKYFDISRQKTMGKLLANAKHLDRVVVLMCLFPIAPGGMIPLLFSQTEIKPLPFLKGVAIGSLPVIALYVCAGDFLMTENYKIIAVIIAILVVIALFAFIFRGKLMAWLRPKVKHFLED